MSGEHTLEEKTGRTLREECENKTLQMFRMKSGSLIDRTQRPGSDMDVWTSGTSFERN